MRLHLHPRLDMTSVTCSCPTYLYALPCFATTFLHASLIRLPTLAACLFLSLLTFSLLARFASLRGLSFAATALVDPSETILETHDYGTLVPM